MFYAGWNAFCGCWGGVMHAVRCFMQAGVFYAGLGGVLCRPGGVLRRPCASAVHQRFGRLPRVEISLPELLAHFSVSSHLFDSSNRANYDGIYTFPAKLLLQPLVCAHGNKYAPPPDVHCIQCMNCMHRVHSSRTCIFLINLA